MPEDYSADWARGIIADGIQQAQELVDDPAQVEELLQSLQEKLKNVPEAIASTFANVPLMAQMVKSYITREYTVVSPKVIVSLLSAFVYLVKQKDLIPDDIPLLGMADDVAVATVAMAINDPELKAYKAWREMQANPPIDVEPADAEPVDVAAADVADEPAAE